MPGRTAGRFKIVHESGGFPNVPFCISNAGRFSSSTIASNPCISSWVSSAFSLPCSFLIAFFPSSTARSRSGFAIIARRRGPSGGAVSLSPRRAGASVSMGAESDAALVSKVCCSSLRSGMSRSTRCFRVFRSPFSFIVFSCSLIGFVDLVLITLSAGTVTGLAALSGELPRNSSSSATDNSLAIDSALPS
jgi:hypothetical protein